MAFSDVIILLEFLGTILAGLVAAAVVHRSRLSIRTWVRPREIGALRRRAAAVLLGSMLAGYVVVFSALSLVKHANFRTYNDLAIFTQVMWSTCQGRWFETTLIGDRPVNFLGHHFSPALSLLTPLYCLWPDAACLLILQTACLALGAVPIYLYARKETTSRLLALTLSAAYFLYPVLHWVNYSEFHAICLSVPLLSFATYSLLTRRYRPFFVLLILSLLVKEEMAFVAAAFAMYALLVHRRYLMGAALLLLAAGWACGTMCIVMPAISQHPYAFTDRYAYLGDSIGEMALSLLLHPLMVLEHLLIPAKKLEFLLHLLVPLGFLPLLGPDTLILTLPTLSYSLLSDHKAQYALRACYSAPLIPLLFLASVTGIRRLLRWKGYSTATVVSAFILTTSFMSYLLYSPGPLARYFNQTDEYVLWPHLASAYEALAAIPADASVMASCEFAPHLAAREQIYIDNIDYLPVQYVFQDYTARTAGPGYPALLPSEHELAYPLYETVFDQDGYCVRRYEDSVAISNPAGVEFEDELKLLAYQWRDQGGLLSPVLKPGGYLDPIVAWRAEGQLTERYAFFVHLLDQNSHRWAQVDQEVERGVYRTTLWEPGMVVADHYRLNVPWGTPPGEYQVLIGVYSSATGQRLRPICNESEVRDNALSLGSVQVVKPDSAASPEAASPQHRLDIRFNDELELVGHDLEMTAVQPGETIPLILTWRALASITGEYTIAPLLDQVDGARRLRCLEEPVGLTYRPDKWEVSEVVRDWHEVHVPPDSPAGQYEILLEVLNAGETIGEISLAHLEVQGRSRDYAAPAVEFPMEARAGEEVLFLGYDLDVDRLKPGQSVEFTLYWQALDEMEVSYTVFTHLLDAEERVWGQADSIPLGGEAPTTSWLRGEVIADVYEIALDPETPKGEYAMEIGMYDPDTMERLPVYDAQGTLQGDRILLSSVNVAP